MEKFKFCDECHSIIKNGLCTNKKCQKTELEMYSDTVNDFIKKYATPKYYKKIINEFNNCQCLDSKFDCESLENSDELIKANHDVADLEKMGIEIKIKYVTDIEGGYNFIEIKKIKPSMVRGRVKKSYPYYLKFRVIWVLKNCNQDITVYFGSFNKRDWFFTSNLYNDESGIEFTMQFHISIGYIYWLSKRWSIDIKKNSNDLGFRYAIDKQTANKILLLRNKKEDTNRRITLLHLVNSYQRNKPKNVDVKTHLRANENFNIDDLECHIHPSLKDMQKVGRYKHEK